VLQPYIQMHSVDKHTIGLEPVQHILLFSSEIWLQLKILWPELDLVFGLQLKQNVF